MAHTYTRTKVECPDCGHLLDEVERDLNPENYWDEDLPEVYMACAECGGLFDAVFLDPL